MTARRPDPLDIGALNRLALAYVGRFATTQAKLAQYLRRKIAQRGWNASDEAPVDAIVARCAAAGYVDDEAYAEARSAALTRRAYGARRIGRALAAAGIDRDLAARVLPDAAAAGAAAEAFARRRRFGPFASGPVDSVARRRAMAAMLRAGHSFELAQRFTDPGQADAHGEEDSEMSRAE